jgi:hypothetical protein
MAAKSRLKLLASVSLKHSSPVSRATLSQQNLRVFNIVYNLLVAVGPVTEFRFVDDQER